MFNDGAEEVRDSPDSANMVGDPHANSDNKISAGEEHLTLILEEKIIYS